MRIVSTFQDKVLVDVWNDPSDETRGKVIELWSRNNVLPSVEEVEKRAKQIVLAALDKDQRAIGVNTVYEGHFPPSPSAPGRVHCYFYRMFIDQEHRLPHLMRVMTNSAFEVLQKSRTDTSPSSFIIITENQGLTGPGMLKMFQRYGYRVWMRTAQGQLVIRKDFVVSQVEPQSSEM